jgi:hypothetical protein
MSRKGPRKGPQRRAPKGNPHAGLTTCLRCDQEFWSWDRRQNRLCASCHEAIAAEPSDEDEHPLHTPWRRPRNRDDR